MATRKNAPVIKAIGRRQAIPTSATPDEAAAIVAALERFMRATALQPATAPPSGPDGWQAAALREGVSRDLWATAAGEQWLNAALG